MNEFNLSANSKTDNGTKFCRNMRNSGSTPAVLYGKSKKNLMLELNHNEIIVALQKPGFLQAKINLSIDGKKAIKVIVKDYVMHAVKNQVMHVDFNYA